MKARVERDELRDALKRVLPVVGTNHTGLSITAGVRITATKTGLELQATDLDLTITTSCTASIGEPGVVVVPGKLLAAIVGKARAGAIDLAIDGERLTVTAGALTANVTSYKADGWPRIKPADGESLELGETLWAHILQVIHAAGTDDNRPVLTGVHFHSRFVYATDSFRLAALELEHGLAITVPATLFARVAAVVGDGPVDMVASTMAADFTDGVTTWHTRLILGDPPKIDNFLKPGPDTIVCDREALIEAISQVNVLTGIEDGRPVALNLVGDTLEVAQAAADVGSVETAIEASGTYGGRIAFNAKFLTELLANLTGDEVTLNVTDELKPALATDGVVTCMSMPIRVP